MQKGYLSPGRWTWFKSDNSDFMAYSERMLHLRIITNKAGFNDEHSFCNKEDMKAFISFLKEFVILPYKADIEYISSHKISKDRPIHKVITRYFQPGTPRIVYEDITYIEVNAYTKTSDIENKAHEIRTGLRKKIVDSFSEDERESFFDLLDEIKEKLDKQTDWS